jgi:hypothetical protein
MSSSASKMMAATTAIGVKGSDVYTAAGVQDERVALSALLNRGVSSEVIKPLIDAIIAKDEPNQLEDLFVLAFQTRDIRGGKGEREVFRIFYDALLANPKTCYIAMDLLDLVPEYGSWRDLFIEAVVPSLPYQSEPEMRDRIVEIVQAQWLKDQTAAPQEKPISLMAKWMPRENRNKYLAGLLAGRLFPSATGPTQYSSQMRLYRKAVASLNRHIQTTEIAMSGGEWETIEPSKVPGRCLQKHIKAFLNEVGTTKKGQQAPHDHPLRHPENQDRMACRQHFQEHFAKAVTGEEGAKVNGSKTVFPHELVRKAESLIADESAIDERNAILAVWRQMVADAKAGGGLGRSIAMCDFSGSMSTSGNNNALPFWVSMALGLLIAEATTEEFQNTFLTFDSQPTMHTMRAEDDLFERIKSIGRLGQGLSTDFQKAMDLVLSQLKAKRCRPGQEPENLIVLTDMNWDQACGSDRQSVYTGNGYRNVVKTSAWQTHVEMIREAFKRAGEDMWGEGQGLKMPRIVIWNIASTTTDFHAQADTEGVAMLSGWSPSLFKALQTEGPDGVKPMTPMEMLRAQLDVERYDQVILRVRAAMGCDMPLLTR